MKKQIKYELDFVIDQLTNSIINVISGDSFQTEIALVTKNDLKNITKKNGWNFNWRAEFQDISKEIYKLTIFNNPNIIQGLLSVSIMDDHVYMNLLESAPFNIGVNKIYEGVAGNLVAYACKTSFQKGFDGYVAFIAKTKLIKHYEQTLGAYHFKDQKMFIETDPAKRLVEKYFKD
ncbi:hypothetical protein LUD75_00330 [Epilithonimonas sp. JDS]|uniref:hypothetical protein n=1 Tax=Epilithonimonas sp. JDS TaxID=2902797 RepID=UPI001E43A7F3|nr:hypothetical protein [Epilithonimonas sp. JDS]MCD9853134.1 hypothetical protein [Epilithonimonas sp. JDS]